MSECYKIAQDAAAAAFFLSFSNRKNNGSRSLLILLWERDQIDLGLSERERERASSSFSLGFCSRKKVLHPARIRKIDV